MNEYGQLKVKDLKGIATRSAIKHWQRVGLLPDERRRQNTRDHRVFSPDLLPRIKEIARLRSIGLSCAGIMQYFELQEKKTQAPN